MRLTLFALAILFLHISQIFGQDKSSELLLSKNATPAQIETFLDSTVVKINKLYYGGNYSDAIELATKALRLTAGNGIFPSQFKIRSYLGNIYVKLENVELAEEIFQENFAKAKIYGKEDVIMGTTIDLGNIYQLQNDNEKAIAYYLETAAIAEKTKDVRRMFIVNANIAEIYIKVENKPLLATNYLKRAEKELANIDILFYTVNLELLYGYYYLKLGEAQKSIKHFKKSIAFSKKENYVAELSAAYEGLTQAEELAGNYDESLQAFKIWDSLKQNQYNLGKQEYKQSIENKRQNEEIKLQLQSKELENQLIKQRGFTNRLILYATLLVVLVLTFFLITLWRADSKRKELILDLESENKKYLEEKQKSEKLAKVKSKFFSTVTHDLRTPLYGIIGLSNTLIDDPQLESHRRDLQSLKFSADYLLALINDVLQINKLDSRKEEAVNNQQFSIQELMKDLVESLQYMKTQNNNLLNVTFGNEIPKYIIGDRLKVSQILMNLIANALKFTKNGKVSVSISLENRNKENVFLLFEVKDDGVGIQLQNQKLIFEEFGQLEKADKFEGTGLGLTIVSKLLKQMHSKILLKSDGIKGSIFYFTLKFAVAENVENIAIDKIENDELYLLKGKKVLIVEDNIINQMVTKKIISKYSMDFELAQNGLEAVNMVKNTNYDIILMDINMPVMDGLEATKKIRTFNDKVPIILLTAVELVESDERTQNLNFEDVIIKPYAINNFLRVLIKNISS